MSVIVRSAEDIRALVGEEFGTSSWVEVNQGQIDGFADLTGDHQWIHTDPERAASGPFGTTIAHGYLTLSLLVPLLEELLVVENRTSSINYGLDKVRFPARCHPALVSGCRPAWPRQRTSIQEFR